MKKIIQAINVLKFRLGSIKPICGPLKVSWYITENCNSRCISCNAWKKKKHEQLSTEECKVVISDLAIQNVLSLSFTGGEPLMRKDIFELISFAKSKGMNTTINTNGLIFSKKLLESGLDIMYVSIDGSNKKTHDLLRGINGSFDTTAKNIKRLIKLVKEKKSKLKIYFNVTINKKNLNELSDIVKLADEMGIHGISIQPIQQCSHTIFLPIKDLLLEKHDAEKIRMQIDNILAAYGNRFGFFKAYLKNIPEFISNPDSMFKYRCAAGYLTLQLGSQGEIYPCPAYFKNLGDLKKKRFREIWFSKEMHTLRDEIRQNKHPICWFSCVSPLNMVVSYFPFKLHKILNLKSLKHIIRKGG